MIPGSLDNPPILRGGRKVHATAAWTDPMAFVRAVASLIPKEPEDTTPPVMERLSNAQLDALIAELQSGLDPAAADEDAQIIQ